jgi:hypothetical protein
MLKTLSKRQVKTIADLARDAREARDQLLRGVGDEATGEPEQVRGERDRIPAGGLEDVPGDRNAAVRALREAIEALDPEARFELFALMRIGQGELAAGDWGAGLDEAEGFGDQGLEDQLADDIDLQTHLDRGLYAIGGR